MTALLDRAARGPDQPWHAKPSKRNRRVTARTAATGPSLPPAEPSAATDPHRQTNDEDSGEELAEVIPLGVFDARKEAQQWW